MALARSRRDSGMNYWPGFVDALSTLILSIIFLLTVFMVAQFFLSQEVAGKDTALARLNAQISRAVRSACRWSGPARPASRTRSRSCARRSPRPKANATGCAAPPQAPRTPMRARPRSASSTRSSTRESRRRRAPSRRSRSSISRSARCAGRSPRSRTRSARRSKKRRNRQLHIADLGQRLNVALAQRVQELSRYRSDFFGKLRDILGNRPDIRVVGDRFVFQSEVFFDSGAAVLRPEGRAELDKLASALLDLDKQIPSEINWVLRVDGHTDMRPVSATSPFKSNWDLVRRARHLGGAVSDQQGRFAAAPRRRRLRRVSADRSRHHRRSLQPQSPHRAETDGEVTAMSSPDERSKSGNGGPGADPASAPLHAGCSCAMTARRRRRDRAVAAHLAGRLSRTRFCRAARLVARALAQRAGAVGRHRDRGSRNGRDRLRHRRSAHALSRPDRGRAGALGIGRRHGAASPKPSGSRRPGSISTSTPTMRARSASTRSRDFPSAAPASIRSPASRFTA